MKLSVIINSKQSLESLAKQNLPIAINWELKMLLSKVNPEVLAFEQLRDTKIISYGEKVKDENGKETDMFQVKLENIEMFQKEMSEILKKEITVDVPEIHMKEIIEYNKNLKEPIQLSVNDLILLDWLIK